MMAKGSLSLPFGRNGDSPPPPRDARPALRKAPTPLAPHHPPPPGHWPGLGRFRLPGLCWDQGSGPGKLALSTGGRGAALCPPRRGSRPALPGVHERQQRALVPVPCRWRPGPQLRPPGGRWARPSAQSSATPHRATRATLAPMAPAAPMAARGSAVLGGRPLPDTPRPRPAGRPASATPQGGPRNCSRGGPPRLCDSKSRAWAEVCGSETALEICTAGTCHHTSVQIKGRTARRDPGVN